MSAASTKYAALSEQDKMFWIAALGAVTNDPNLRGKVALDLATTPLPEINAVSVRVALRGWGIRWAGTLVFTREQLDLAYEPVQMMLTDFGRLFGRAGSDFSKETRND